MGYDFHLDDRDARVTPAGPATGEAPGVQLEIDGVRVRAALEHGTRSGEAFVTLDGRRERIFLASRGDVHFVHWRGRSHRIEAWNALDRAREAALRAGGAEEIRAPMPGVVVSLGVAVGADVEPGAVLLTIESMKLQTAITATHAAQVVELHVAAGDHFDQGSPLVRLGPRTDEADEAQAREGRAKS